MKRTFENQLSSYNNNKNNNNEISNKRIELDESFYISNSIQLKNTYKIYNINNFRYKMHFLNTIIANNILLNTYIEFKYTLPEYNSLFILYIGYDYNLGKNIIWYNEPNSNQINTIINKEYPNDLEKTLNVIQYFKMLYTSTNVECYNISDIKYIQPDFVLEDFKFELNSILNSINNSSETKIFSDNTSFLIKVFQEFLI
jgi:hypothetical protein